MSEHRCCERDTDDDGNCDRHKPVIHAAIVVPQAWNIGRIEDMTPEERAAAEAPPPIVRIDVYPPGHYFPRREYGRTDATAVIIGSDGNLVGCFGPELVTGIVAYWREHGVVV